MWYWAASGPGGSRDFQAACPGRLWGRGFLNELAGMDGPGGFSEVGGGRGPGDFLEEKAGGAPGH